MRDNPHGQIRFSVPSSLKALDDLCECVGERLERSGLSDRCFAVELLLREFAGNAMVHGNGLDHQKSIQVSLRIGTKWITLTVEDEGRGFDWRGRDRSPPCDTATSGRGLAIGALYAGRVRFNRAGNRVTLWILKEVGKENQHA